MSSAALNFYTLVDPRQLAAQDPRFARAVASSSCVHKLPSTWFQQVTCQNEIWRNFRAWGNVQDPARPYTNAPFLPWPRPHGSVTFWSG